MRAVETEYLSKTYSGGNKAVDKISFCLEQGEIFGFLGPNGAGKTTTVKLLCGMLQPTDGRCQVFGIDPTKEPERLHELAGVVTEHAQMYDHLTGMENLMFYGSLFGMNKPDCEKKAVTILERLDLLDAGKQKLSAYSTGMRQRLSLARAMIHSPKILFLDEPTSGLDPESAQNVNSLIQELAKNGTTIFLCTHQLRYAQEICTSYGLMNKGQLLATGNLETLRAMVASRQKVCIRASQVPVEIDCRKIENQRWEFTVETEDEIPQIVRKIVNEGGNLYEVFSQKISLEEIYFSLIDRIANERLGEQK